LYNKLNEPFTSPTETAWLELILLAIVAFEAGVIAKVATENKEYDTIRWPEIVKA
jgi:hypothetical protein